MTHSKLPKVVIVGRPNVGKSSLFNRIVGTRRAIVDPTAGTTRDSLHAKVSVGKKAFMLVDTGGYEVDRPGDIARLVLGQLRSAMKIADVILFVTDSTAGILPQDRELALTLRKTTKRIFLVVNKVDSPSSAEKAGEFYELGLGEPYAVSATTANGINALLGEIAREIDETPSGAAQELRPITVAIIGRPNVGKSSYINAIVQEERAIVHSTAGTTRDAIDINFKYNGKNFLLIDTAGIRHNTKLAEATDFYSGVRSKEAIDRSDVAVIIIDGFDGLREDDSRIITLAMEEGKAVILIVNKCDLITDTAMRQYKGMLVSKLNVIKSMPVIFTSCKSGKNVASSLAEIESVYERSRDLLKPNELIRILNVLRDAPAIRDKEITVSHVSQDGIAPPKFNIRVKASRPVPDNIKRQMENIIRSLRNYEGVPIRVEVVRPTRAGATMPKRRMYPKRRDR